MNFTSVAEANNNLSALVTATTKNGADANGKQNPNPATLTLTPSSVNTSEVVNFDPSDIYGHGISACC